MRALMDSNILIDILSDRDFNREALDLVQTMQRFGDVELWVSAKTYCDTFHLLRKKMSSEDAHNAIIKSFSWINTCSIDSADIQKAAEARWPDFEDCLINTCAEKIKADYIITRDKKGFTQSKISHGNAEEFMAYVSETMHLEYGIEEL